MDDRAGLFDDCTGSFDDRAARSRAVVCTTSSGPRGPFARPDWFLRTGWDDSLSGGSAAGATTGRGIPRACMFLPLVGVERRRAMSQIGPFGVASEALWRSLLCPDFSSDCFGRIGIAPNLEIRSPVFELHWMQANAWGSGEMG
jgi:hypothetical protein